MASEKSSRNGSSYGRMTEPAASAINAACSFQSRDHLVSGRFTSLPSTRIAFEPLGSGSLKSIFVSSFLYLNMRAVCREP